MDISLNNKLLKKEWANPRNILPLINSQANFKLREVTIVEIWLLWTSVFTLFSKEKHLILEIFLNRQYLKLLIGEEFHYGSQTCSLPNFLIILFIYGSGSSREYTYIWLDLPELWLALSGHLHVPDHVLCDRQREGWLFESPTLLRAAAQSKEF